MCDPNIIHILSVEVPVEVIKEVEVEKIVDNEVSNFIKIENYEK